MNYKSTISTIIQSFSGQQRTLAVPITYIQFCGKCYHTAAMLSQLVFWTGKTKVKHQGKEWIVKTDKEWDEEICLSPSEVKKAANKLIAAGLLEIIRKKFGDSPKKHYHLKTEEFTNQLISFLKEGISKMGEIKRQKNRKKSAGMIQKRKELLASKPNEGEHELSFNDSSNHRSTIVRGNHRSTTVTTIVERQLQPSLNDKTMELSFNDESIPVDIQEELNRGGKTEESFSPSFPQKNMQALTAYMCLQNEEMQIQFIADKMFFKNLEALGPLIKEFCETLTIEQRDIERASDAWHEFKTWIGCNRKRSWHQDFLNKLKGKYGKTETELKEIQEYYLAHVEEKGYEIKNWQVGLEKAVKNNWGQRSFKKTESDKQIREQKYKEAKNSTSEKTNADLAHEKANRMKAILKGLTKGDYATEQIPTMLQGMATYLNEIETLMGKNPTWKKSIAHYRNWIEQNTPVATTTEQPPTPINNVGTLLGRFAQQKSSKKILKKPKKMDGIADLFSKAERSLKLLKANPNQERVQILTDSISALSAKGLIGAYKTKFTKLRKSVLEALQNVEIPETNNSNANELAA